MSVEDLISTCDHVRTVLRSTAAELRKSGAYEEDAALLETAARALESATRSALAAPDETPPSGLAQLVNELAHPTALVKGVIVQKLARKYVRGRSIVRRLLAAAEITGDVEAIADAQAWLDDE